MQLLARLPRTPALALFAAMTLGASALAWAALHPAPARPPPPPMVLGDDACSPDLDD